MNKFNNLESLDMSLSGKSVRKLELMVKRLG